MRVFYLTVLTLYLCNWFAQNSADDEFVDPLDMLNYDRTTKSMKRPPKSNAVVAKPVPNDRCTAFLSRFVNIVLKHTGISNLNYESSERSGDKELESLALVTISVGDLRLLESMVSSKDIDYAEIDRILNGMFTPAAKSDSEFPGSNVFLGTYKIKEVLYWLSIGSILIFLLYVIFRNIGKHVFSIPFVIFIILTLAFASTWYTMYTKAEINRTVHLENMPSHCYSKSKSGWLTFSWLKTNNLDECKKYKEAIYLNPKYSIAVTEVLAEMFGRILMKPVESLGESIYVFNKSALKDFPMWAQLIMVPIIIIILIKTMLLSCALLVGRNLSMKSMFGYGGTSIGAAPVNNETLATKNETHSSFHAFPQSPETPKVNFNINLFHQSPSISNKKTRRDLCFSYDNEELKYNHARRNDTMEMLKNEEIDRVDSKCVVNLTSKKRRRHRTSSV